MKKTVSTFLLAAMLLSCLVGLTGCNSNPENATEPQEKVELTFWHLMDGNGGKALQRQIDSFNNGIGAKENIHVTPVYIDWPGTAAFATALASDRADSLPDVFQLYGEMVSYVKEIDDVLWAEDCISKPYSSVSKEDFIPATLSAFTLNDRMLSVPYAISTLMMYYNQTYLKEAGYDGPPRTIAELAAMLPNIVSKTGAQYGLHAQIRDYELEHFLTIQGENGTYVSNNQNGRGGPVTEIQCQDALKDFLSAWENVVATNTVNFSTTSTTEEFVGGIDAIALMTSARITPVDELIGDSFEWGVAPIPVVNEDDIGGSIVNGSSLVMFNHHDDRRTEAAWKLIEFLVSPEAQTMLMEDMGYFPVTVDTVNYDGYKTAIEKQPRFSVLFDSLIKAPDTAVVTFFPNSSDINTVITNAMLDFVNGKSNVDETAQRIVDECNGILDEYYRENPIE